MWPTIRRTCLSSDSFRPFDWWSPSARASRSRCPPSTPSPRVSATGFPIGRLAARVHGATLLLSPAETTAGRTVLADVEAEMLNSTVTPKMLPEVDTKLCFYFVAAKSAGRAKKKFLKCNITLSNGWRQNKYFFFVISSVLYVFYWRFYCFTKKMDRMTGNVFQKRPNSSKQQNFLVINRSYYSLCTNLCLLRIYFILFICHYL